MSNLVAPIPSSRALGVGPPPPFSCERRAESGGGVRLVLAGELDLTARAHFEQALSDAQGEASRVVLDLRALTLIDCASLSVVFHGAAHALRDGTALTVLDPRGQVRRVLDLTGAPDGVAVLDEALSLRPQLPRADART